MSKKVYMNSAAEREAIEVGKKFMNSTDVVGDMSRAYGTDLSSVRIHADSSSDLKTAQRGVDAFSTGNDIFFARAAFQKNDPASRGLLAHELSHSIQQGVGGAMSGMEHSAPMGAEQGGLIDWFRNLFKKKPKQEKENTLNFMAAGESLPQINGQAMNFKQLTQYANDQTSGSFHEKLLKNLEKQNGVYAGGYTDKREDLTTFIENRYQGTDQGNLLDRSLMNASGTLMINGLNASRLIPVLKTVTGGDLSNEAVGQMYDNLLSGGKLALQNRTLIEARQGDASYERSFKKKPNISPQAQKLRNDAQRFVDSYTPEEVAARDQKFMAGISPLKGLYLTQLRRIKNKYGTYITQLHPEDFCNKVGMSYYEDFFLMQDVVQLMDNDKNGKIFDYENNADDREYKTLADYYFNAFNIITRYFGTDTAIDEAEFNPQSVKDMEIGNIYSEGAMKTEGQIGGPGFDKKEYEGYLKRLKKRFKKEKKSKRLFGRFK